jgi:outer membrane protein TolC
VARAADVIDAQTILTRSQSDYYNALGDYHVSLADLERAMGTGNIAVSVK